MELPLQEDWRSTEFQNKLLFAEKILTQGIHKILGHITLASGCVLPLIQISPEAEDFNSLTKCAAE